MTQEQMETAIYLLHNTYGPPVRHYWIEKGQIMTSEIGNRVRIVRKDEILEILVNRESKLCQQVEWLQAFLSEYGCLQIHAGGA